MGSNCVRTYGGIEMEGAYLWATDYSNTRFVKFNLEHHGGGGDRAVPVELDAMPTAWR